MSSSGVRCAVRFVVGDQVAERAADDVLGELPRQKAPLQADALLDRVDELPADAVDVVANGALGAVHPLSHPLGVALVAGRGARAKRAAGGRTP